MYNPKVEITRQALRQPNFHNSKTTRKVFEPSIEITNQLPPRSNPGPSHYEHADKVKSKQFNAQGNTTNFLSKVPMAQDIRVAGGELPGPGTYIQVYKDDKEPANTSVNSTQLVKPSAFMSTTHRVDFWTNEMQTPFTKQTFKQNPGPGTYVVDKKKADDIKSRLLMEEAQRVPFGSSDERDLNKKMKLTGPGPGTYIDINNPNNSSICKSLNKIKEDRTLAESQGIKIGAFGSTANRWNKSAWNNPKDGPGPG